MGITRYLFEQLIFNKFSQSTRFTQDSPVYPDVWLDFYLNGKKPGYRADLILTPHRKSSASQLFKALSARLVEFSENKEMNDWQMASNGETVVANLTFKELVGVALPMTNWWQNYLWKNQQPTDDQIWIKQLIGAYYYPADLTMPDQENEITGVLTAFQNIADKHFSFELPLKQPPLVLWSISRNRQASITIEKSIACTKADSGRKLFDIDGTGITWAVLDTGIDARHSAFRTIDPITSKPCKEAMGTKKDKFSNHTRIIATYDFTRFRELLSRIHLKQTSPPKILKKQKKWITSNEEDESLSKVERTTFFGETEKDLRMGRMLDWSVLGPLLRIPHNESEYQPPAHAHGTHVAGILGAGLEKDFSPKQMIGMCPKITLYDLRVLDAKGKGDEFNILAAIQFIRWVNSQKNGLVIHGANMSFSITHEVASYACGQTPVCVACEQLVAEGTVVVAAAGNHGQTLFTDKLTGIAIQGFRTVNITDPGNAEEVITVGSTHRDRPHSYGVSYFSSKGPTGDGRIKPDLVAPGEKIVSLSLDEGIKRMDGTSMATPHVSGAAALLLSKHHELIGRPRKVKQILCQTATDLGREKYFQGCGLVDVLRAIQSV